jgi:hypothetical protein
MRGTKNKVILDPIGSTNNSDLACYILFLLLA